jgi:uncharacterized membrane protein YhhN
MLALNLLMIALIFILNYFYQACDFMRVLKCTCSALFALLGVINLLYALSTKQPDKKFYLAMSAGLFFAFLGDVLIDWQFIPGAAVFALGHVCFVVAYCFLQKIGKIDCVIGGSVFAACVLFLFSPLLTFEVPVFRIVCLVYSLIISSMLGKAIGNLVRERSALTATIAGASFLFFFSDLMLVCDWFIGVWDWAPHACMGTYYPALCFLAFAMLVKLLGTERKHTN